MEEMPFSLSCHEDSTSGWMSTGASVTQKNQCLIFDHDASFSVVWERNWTPVIGSSPPRSFCSSVQQHANEWCTDSNLKPHRLKTSVPLSAVSPAPSPSLSFCLKSKKINCNERILIEIEKTLAVPACFPPTLPVCESQSCLMEKRAFTEQVRKTLRAWSVHRYCFFSLFFFCYLTWNCGLFFFCFWYLICVSRSSSTAQMTLSWAELSKLPCLN